MNYSFQYVIKTLKLLKTYLLHKKLLLRNTHFKIQIMSPSQSCFLYFNFITFNFFTSASIRFCACAYLTSRIVASLHKLTALFFCNKKNATYVNTLLVLIHNFTFQHM